jgi:WD40 repeat protein
MKLYSPTLAGLIMLSSFASAQEVTSNLVSFVRDVAPILRHHCEACHGAKTAESNYRLDSFELMMKPGEHVLPPFTAGNFDESEAYRLITAKDADERMPNNGGQLCDVEIQTIAMWIEQGAKFDGQNPAAPSREQIPRDIPHPAAPETYSSALPITAMTFTVDGKRLITSGYHELLIWDPSSGTLLNRVGDVPQRTYGMAFSPASDWLAIAGGSPGVSGEVRLIPWEGKPKDAATPKVLATPEDVYFDLAFRPDGQQLATAGTDGLVRVFDIESGAERLKIESHADWITGVCYSPDGKYLATSSRDKTAKVFDAATGTLLTTYSAHEAPVRAIAFAPDGKSVISAGGNRVHIWNPEDAKLIGEMTGFENDVYKVLVQDDSVLAASADGSVRQFKLSDKTLIRAYAPHPAWVLSLAWDKPSHRIGSGCLNGIVTLWDADKGAIEKQFLAVPPTVTSTK